MTSDPSPLTLPYTVVDAFVDEPSGGLGNPAAVFILDSPLTDEVMQKVGIAMQMPMSCFVLPIEGQEKGEEVKDFRIWWWNSTGGETSLCGHGSIASSVLLSSLYPELKLINYHTSKVGICPSKVLAPLYADINFPLYPVAVPVEEPVRSHILECLVASVPNSSPSDFGEIRRGTLDVIAEWVNTERSLKSLDIDPEAMRPIEARGIAIVSLPPTQTLEAKAAGVEQPDFLVRVFSPRNLVPPEDQVCGSAHSDLLPFFMSKLPSKPAGAEWVSHHASKRGGRLGLVPSEEGTRLSLRGGGAVGRKGEITI